MSENTATSKISVLVDLLEQHTKIHALSIAFSILSVFLFFALLIFTKSSIVLLLLSIAILLTGFYEMLLAIRVGFDRKLFKRVLTTDVNIPKELESMDRSLVTLNLIPSFNSNRELEDRIKGCLTLFKKQTIVCFVQLLFLICAGAIAVNLLN